jgi:hypothetical protein
MPSSRLADLLALAMKDSDACVRANALSAICQRDDLPSDIVIPVLMTELRAATRPSSFSRLRLRQNKEPETPDQVDLFAIYVSVSSLMEALDKHWDDRAIRELSDVLKGWPLDQMPGDVIETVCDRLCRAGTRHALDAVVDTLARGALVRPITRPLREDGFVGRRWFSLLDSDHRDRIGTSLVQRLAALGTNPSTRVYEGSREAWQDLLAKEGSLIPIRLCDSRPSSRPTSPSSKPTKEK